MQRRAADCGACQVLGWGGVGGCECERGGEEEGAGDLHGGWWEEGLGLGLELVLAVRGGGCRLTMKDGWDCVLL